MEEFDEPAKGAGREEVRRDWVNGIREEEGGSVGNREAAIEFTAKGVVVEGLDKGLKMPGMAKIKHGRGCYFLKPF